MRGGTPFGHGRGRSGSGRVAVDERAAVLPRLSGSVGAVGVGPAAWRAWGRLAAAAAGPVPGMSGHACVAAGHGVAAAGGRRGGDRRGADGAGGGRPWPPPDRGLAGGAGRHGPRLVAAVGGPAAGGPGAFCAGGPAGRGGSGGAEGHGVAVAGRARRGGRGGGGDRRVRDGRGGRPGDGVAGRGRVVGWTASLAGLAGERGAGRCGRATVNRHLAALFTFYEYRARNGRNRHPAPRRCRPGTVATPRTARRGPLSPRRRPRQADQGTATTASRSSRRSSASSEIGPMLAGAQGTPPPDRPVRRWGRAPSMILNRPASTPAALAS